MHAPDLIREFHATHPTAVKSAIIKEPLFLPENNPSPFQSPLSTCTPSPCPSPPPFPLTAATFPTPSSSPSELPMEQSLSDSIPPTTTCTSSPPLLVATTSTPNSYGPIFGPTQLLTSTSVTKQSTSPQTPNSPLVTSGTTGVTFEWIQRQTLANLEKAKQKC